ncbi:oxygenase MpaB family protein [Mangrovivirga sp. M17]|uniref:Oxygenase MpaB family protein n=1 Tax=Mangrovivirga halotolerans TaxID=2993936 RepID=A0ABT3RNU2_9BACT|nr:oxygenase MpaB family protein [Mangrovivirga halotolerans]MCX2743468.1 oxygenase MpaB family protein [Mangrovivirga halotolerans]
MDYTNHNDANNHPLNPWRLIGDPLSDSIITNIVRHNEGHRLHEIIFGLIREIKTPDRITNNLHVPIRESIIEFLEETRNLPLWVDPELIRKGEKFYSKYNMEICFLLTFKSLPLCYVCSNGAKALYITGKMSPSTDSKSIISRRLKETMMMIHKSFSPDGLSIEGEGLEYIRKSRLIHALNRYYLKNKKLNSEKWDTSSYGLPLNQQDMAGTLMSFSPIVLKGFDQLKISLTEEEKEAYTHYWRVIGHLLGIVPELVPDNHEKSWELAINIIKHQGAASIHGQELTNKWIQYINSMYFGNLSNSTPSSIISHFTDDVSKASNLNISTILGIRDSKNLKDKMIIQFMTRVFRLQHKILPEGLIEFKNKTIQNNYLYA